MSAFGIITIFFVLVILIGLHSYLSVVLICIFLMANNVKQLLSFDYLLLVKCHFMLFAHIVTGWFSGSGFYI